MESKYQKIHPQKFSNGRGVGGGQWAGLISIETLEVV